MGKMPFSDQLLRRKLLILFDAGIRQQISGLITERGALAPAEAAEMQSARQRCDAEREALQDRQEQARKAREE